MNPLEILRVYGAEYTGRYYSIYRGVVMNDQDEDSTGRLQIYIPNIQTGITVWARSKSFYGGPGFGFKYLTPKVGEVVYVEFESGDPLRGIWSYHPWALYEKPEEFDNDTLGIITPNGNKVLLREKDGAIIIETKGNIDIKTDGIVTKVGKEIHLQEGKVGIPQTTDVVDRLNKLEKKINQYIQAMKTSPPITSSDKGAAFKTHMTMQVGDELALTSGKDIESETIKQPR